MLDYEIKALEHILPDYQEWITHVQTVQKYKNGQPIGLMFNNPDEIITNKIKVCLEKMICEYICANGDFTNNPTDEEKINIIISQEGYKNRAERENELNY